MREFNIDTFIARMRAVVLPQKEVPWKLWRMLHRLSAVIHLTAHFELGINDDLGLAVAVNGAVIFHFVLRANFVERHHNACAIGLNGVGL